MKTLRAFLYLLLFVGGLSLLLWFGYGYINSRLDQRAPTTTDGSQIAAQNSQNQSAPTTDDQAGNATTGSTTDTGSSTATDTAAATASDVTVKTLGELENSYFPAIGTVASAESITLFPQTAGAVKKVNFREGDYVKTGDVLIELTGANLSEHTAETQLKLAETTLANARQAYANLEKTSAQSLLTAGLQLQSAKNQTAALAYDLAVIEQNQAGLADSLDLMRDSWDTTREKNLRDEQKTMRDIDDLIFTLNSAQDSRSRTQRQIDDLNDQLSALPTTGDISATGGNPEEHTEGEAGSAPSSPNVEGSTPNLAASLEAQLAKLQAALEAQDKGIEELYQAIDKSKYGLNTAQNGATLGENTVLGQITQSESQSEVLDLTLLSTKTKLGYTGDSSDGLKLAEQAYNATKLQLATALDATKNQVKLAELNVELTKSQAGGLQIKAPFDGVITSLDLYPGQTVGPQGAVLEMLNPQTFELEVGVDVDTADRISADKPAILELAGREIEVPIKSIGLKVDNNTRLVKVTLRLPNIFFKLNQNLKVLLPVSPTGSAVPDGETPDTAARYLPLDAVIIGTEDQFVYVNDNGKAKKVNVELGDVIGDQVAILSGLPEGAEVIVDGAKRLLDGQTLNVVNN